MSPLKPYQGKIIVLLTQQNLLIAELYRFFSGLFPESREFWTDMSKGKMSHATWMEYLYTKAQAGTVHFQEDKMKTYTVESFVKFLEDNLAKVKDKAPSQQAAFSMALDIENSMLVRRAFDHFQSSDRELSMLLDQLREKMKDHRKRLDEAGARNTGSPKPRP